VAKEGRGIILKKPPSKNELRLSEKMWNFFVAENNFYFFLDNQNLILNLK